MFTQIPSPVAVWLAIKDRRIEKHPVRMIDPITRAVALGHRASAIHK